MNSYAIQFKALTGLDVSAEEVCWYNQQTTQQFQNLVYPQTGGQRWIQFLSIGLTKTICRWLSLPVQNSQEIVDLWSTLLDGQREFAKLGQLPWPLNR